MEKPGERAVRGHGGAPPPGADPADDVGQPGLVCAEYTPELQLELLGIEPSMLEPPILDLGCGAAASLVRHLQQRELRGVIGLDPRAPVACGFVRASWFELSFPSSTWRTLIAHQSFALHFLHAHLRSESVAARFAHKYLELLRSLQVGGRFFYAPGLPFVEEHLDPGAFRVTRRPVPVASIPPAALDLAALYGPDGIYAASVERLR